MQPEYVAVLALVTHMVKRGVINSEIFVNDMTRVCSLLGDADKHKVIRDAIELMITAANSVSNKNTPAQQRPEWLQGVIDGGKKEDDDGG